MAVRAGAGLVVGTVLLAGAFGIASATASAQERVSCPLAQPDAIVIHGDVDAPVIVTRADLLAMPHVSVEAAQHSGEVRVYSGPTLDHVLARAGVPQGAQLRGAAMNIYVVVEAADGYRAVYALAELDAGFRRTVPLVALTQDGEPLDANAGPYQVINPDDQRHARWVRQVTCLRIARDAGPAR